MDTAGIKSQIDIVEFIEKFIPLKKAGANYQAHCPFHSEKTPSFIVSPAKQIYKCFSCDKSGDIFSFLQEYKKLNFNEALQEICDTYNIPHPQTKKQINTQELHNKLKALSEIYQSNLLSNDPIATKLMGYLQGRGFDKQDIARYALGYCKGQEWRKYFTAQEAQCVGILSQNEKCLFTNRLIITLHNHSYKVIGFVGRTHPYANFYKSPKYINSKESFIYNKSQNFYNIARAKKHIIESKKALIVEGYLDSISADKMGFKNCIATGGTAFNKAFLSQLAKLECELIFTFDNDPAGQKNIINALRVCLDNGYTNIYKGTLKNQAKDLNEVMEKGEKPIFTKSEGVGYYLKSRIMQCKTPHAKEQILNDFKAYITAQKNPFLKQDLIKKSEDALNIRLFDKHQPPAFSKSNNHLKDIIFYNVIMNEANAYLSAEYIEDELENYTNSYKHYLTGTMDKIAFDMSQRQDIQLLNQQEFKKVLFQLKVECYNALITKAKNKGDFKYAIALSHKKQELIKELY